MKGGATPSPIALGLAVRLIGGSGPAAPTCSVTIRAVHAGQKRIPPEIAAELAYHATDDALTTREIDVLRLIAAGNANKNMLHTVADTPSLRAPAR